MKRSISHLTRAIGLGALLAALVSAGTAPAARAADVILEQKVTATGFGGMGESESVSKITCTSDRERSETSTQMKGLMARVAGGPMASIRITRLDRELIWKINPKDKTYTETTFAEMRAMMAEAKSKLAEAGDKAKGAPPAGDLKLRGDAKVERTGKQETICGFACEQVTLTMTTTATDPRTGLEGTQYMVADLWLAKSFPGSEVYKAYNRAFVEKAGIADLAGGMGGANPYAAQMSQLAESIKDLDGTPLRERISLEAASAGLTGAGGRSGEAARQAPGEGRQVMFSTAIEMTRIETGDAPAAMFEVPAGYTKVEEKHWRQATGGGSRVSD